MKKKYILAIDEGTTSVRTIVYDIEKKQIIDNCQRTFKQYYPNTSWVEQDANEIMTALEYTLNEALKNISPQEVIGLGITNQRETVVAWDKATGNPIYKAIVWQDRRTAKAIEKLPLGIKRKIKNRTGLIPNAYFSASKMKWIIENVPLAKKLMENNQLCMGTVDSYIAYKLTGKFVTDTTNASRTMLFNINSLKWDEELCNYFKIPISVLPEVVDSNEYVGLVNGYNFPLCGIIGDQQSSLVGQACLKKGMAKATYGTGCFVLLNVGQEPIKLNNMLSTVGYTINGKTTYALEGSVYSACNAIDWLKSNLGLYADVAKTADICLNLESNEGVYFVPAFNGIGAPYWDDSALGTIVGMTLATNRSHIIRACIESIAYSTNAVVRDMTKKSVNIKELHVDGGGSKNVFLLQYQADMIGRSLLKSAISESTAMGAVYMAGLSQKIFKLSDIEKNYKVSAVYSPTKSLAERKKLMTDWERAVKTARYYSKGARKHEKS